MLKAEVENKLLETEKELKELKKNIKEGLQAVANDTCNDSHAYIRDFCETIGVNPPASKREVVLEGVMFPLGASEDEVELLVNGETVEFDYINIDN